MMHIIIVILGSLIANYGGQVAHQIGIRNKLDVMADSAYTYCLTNDYEPRFFLLIDMKIHSGRKRFFIYDYQSHNVMESSLVSHGCGDSLWGSDETKTCPVFSNVPESHCSSLGKYRVGKRGYSNWGININYRLHGLEKSNGNANARDVVLHSWFDISEEETYPAGSPEGWGCPAVSNDFMTALDSVLIKSRKPILLWIYQ